MSSIAATGAQLQHRRDMNKLRKRVERRTALQSQIQWEKQENAGRRFEESEHPPPSSCERGGHLGNIFSY
jgi:hypothetical protein